MATVVTRFTDKTWTELTIQVPPLAERASNVVFLAELFILMSMPLARRSRPVRLSEQAKLALTAYSWPGNAQELKGVIERALSLCHGEAIGLEHLPQDIANKVAGLEQGAAEHSCGSEVRPLTLREEIEALEKKRILEALQKYPTQRDAAAALDMPMTTFLKRLDAFGIPRVRGGGTKNRAPSSPRHAAA